MMHYPGLHKFFGVEILEPKHLEFSEKCVCIILLLEEIVSASVLTMSSRGNAQIVFILFYEINDFSLNTSEFEVMTTIRLYFIEDRFH